MGNLVQGNYIGTKANGTEALGNDVGVSFSNGASDNTIGGTANGAGNTIAFNNNDGIYAISLTTTGNAFLGNSLFSNGELGIDLINDGVTANDAGDADTGHNNLQNFPTFVEVTINGSGDLEVTYHVAHAATQRHHGQRRRGQLHRHQGQRHRSPRQ